MIQALLVGMMAGVGLEDGEMGGACSVRLPTVIPYKVSIGRGQWQFWQTSRALSLSISQLLLVSGHNSQSSTMRS